MVWKLLKGRGILPLLAAIAALIVASSAWAQATTGSLRVSVVDEAEGLDVPGVTLQLQSPQLIGGVQERETDGFGQHLFVELPPGVYELVASKEGFSTVTVREIRVNLNRTTPLTVELRAGAVIEVEVDAERRAVEVESTTRGTVLTREFLDRVPAGRDYQSVIQFTAGVQDNGTGNPNIGGGAFNENTYTLDGVNITDPVTGTFSQNFNYDALQQIEVLLGGYAPEYGTSIGGAVNLITRSGGNNLEYNFNAFYFNGNWAVRADERLAADGFPIAPTGFDQTFDGYQLNALLSGPVIRDKAWFLLSYSGVRSLIAIAGTPQARDFDRHNFLAKLTIQPSPEHRFTLNFIADPTNIANQVQGTPFIKADAQEQQTQGSWVTSARWQWFLSPTVNLDTVLSYQKSYLENYAVPCTHDRTRNTNQCEPGELEGAIDFETPGRLGGLGGAFDSVNAVSFDFDDRTRLAAITRLAVVGVDDPFGGTHDFKFGAETNQFIWDRLVGITGNQQFVDLNAVFFDPTTLTNWYWVEASQPIDFTSSSSQISFFAQDSWKPVRNLTINWGTRYDSFVIRNDIGEPVLSAGLFGPRLFASWDPFKDQRTKIATGWGRFNDTGRLAVADYTSASGFGSKLYWGEAQNNFVGRGDQLRVYGPRANLNTAYDRLRTPRVDEVILLLEREVVEDLAIVSNMSAKFSRFMFEQDDVNLIWDEDGSAIIGSRLGDPINFYGRLRTPALAQRDFYQWDLGIRKIDSRRWYLDAFYTYINGIGSSNNALSGSFIIDPQTRFNYGNLLVDRRHQVKANGYWNIPNDPNTTSLSASFVYYAGIPVERFYWREVGTGGYGTRVRPRGEYLRFNSYWFLNLGITQAIDVRRGQLGVQLNVLNITNNRFPWFSNLGTIAQQNRLQTAVRQDPPQIWAGLIYEY